MNTERQPLLSAPDENHHHIVRPDLRNSPVDVLVDCQNDDGKNFVGNSNDCYKVRMKNFKKIKSYRYWNEFLI